MPLINKNIKLFPLNFNNNKWKLHITLLIMDAILIILILFSRKSIIESNKILKFTF